jgi:tRNA(His) guanylyltransferase
MDALGDRMKMYEGMETERRSMPRLPLMVRIDGKGFSKWTRGLQYPFDPRLESLRVATTKHLVREMGAVVGYCQSDEITLAMWAQCQKTSLYCQGKFQKVVSHAASITTAVFNSLVPQYLPEKVGTPAMFDARAWCVPSLEEAANVLLWREQDASKNSVSMAARSVYSHSQIVNKSCAEMQEMLFQAGINWNDYPDWAKRGTYVARRENLRAFSTEELESLPPKHEARRNPNLKVLRNDIVVLDLPPIGTLPNRVEILFKGK